MVIESKKLNYNIRLSRLYVLGLCDHIQLKMVNIMHVCIVAQVSVADQFNLTFFCCFISHIKIKTRIDSKSCTVRNALKKQTFHKEFISIHCYEKKHNFYNSGTICGGILNPTSPPPTNTTPPPPPSRNKLFSFNFKLKTCRRLP